MRCRIYIRLIAWWRHQTQCDLLAALEEIANAFDERRALNLNHISWRLVRWFAAQLADEELAEIVWAARRERDRRLSEKKFHPVR